MSFERRRKGEMTTEYLGRVLQEYLGYPEMASRARQGHFDDYFCPPEVDDGLNIHRLVDELLRRSQGIRTEAPQRVRVLEVIQAAKGGEFDGTKEEANRWAASKEGQDSFRMLIDQVIPRGNPRQEG